MEISKTLQVEISLVQNKLKNAIRDHQICVGKLKDDPNNTDVLGRIQEIQLHIVSLGKWQKQVVQRLREEVEIFKADNVNGTKVSVAALLGLDNNNHITNNNDAVAGKDLNGLDDRSSKEDYEEEVVRNDDVPSPIQNAPRKIRSGSVESLSPEEDVIEVPSDNNSVEKQSEDESETKTHKQVSFLESLGLITASKFSELQNRRAERKRRSTANPQFVYSNWEFPVKRKRHAYLQSAGSAPQTRQTTARLNGPSPPPSKVAKHSAAKATTKSFIPTQKATGGRPNILRNDVESKVFVCKEKPENGINQLRVKDGKSYNKALHIPGLPSGLTIERIENDSVICVSCRNPGILSICERCSSKYHVSCHSVSPVPLRTCPKCASKDSDSLLGVTIKKENELAATAHTSRSTGKAGEDSEVNKAGRGFHKGDAVADRQLLPSALGIGSLPSSTFLIPISANAVPGIADAKSDVGNYPKSDPRVNYFPQSEIHQSYLIVKKITEPENEAVIVAETTGLGDLKSDSKSAKFTDERERRRSSSAASDDRQGGESKRRRATEITLVHLDDDSPDKKRSKLPAEDTGSKKKPGRKRNADMLNKVFSGNDSSHNVSDDKRGSSAQGTVECREPIADARQRIALSELAEHVKLEEAHLPAPFRARIASQMDEKARGNKSAEDFEKPTSIEEDVEEVVEEELPKTLNDFVIDPEDQEESASAFELQDLEFLASMQNSQPLKIPTNDFNVFELQARSSHGP